MVKIQLMRTEEERHSLSQDMVRFFEKPDETADTIIETFKDEDAEETILKASSFLLMCRSRYLHSKLKEHSEENNPNIKYKLNLTDLNYSLVKELLRYIYTDKVENIEVNASKLLPLSVKYSIAGLTALCERALLESLTPSNVPSILMLADQWGCESLRKAALHYCEESDAIKDNVYIGKTLAWRVMEMVNPDLFLEACESIGSSSSLSTPGSCSD